MIIQLNINGSFFITFYTIGGFEILDGYLIKEIYNKLNSCDYLINMDDKTVSSLDDISMVLYRFTLDVLDATEYDFELIDDEEE